MDVLLLALRIFSKQIPTMIAVSEFSNYRYMLDQLITTRENR